MKAEKNEDVEKEKKADAKLQELEAMKQKLHSEQKQLDKALSRRKITKGKNLMELQQARLAALQAVNQYNRVLRTMEVEDDHDVKTIKEFEASVKKLKDQAK